MPIEESMLPIELIEPAEPIPTFDSAYTLNADTAWDKPLATYNVSEFLLLLIAVLLIIRTVLGLFTRKWGGLNGRFNSAFTRRFRW